MAKPFIKWVGGKRWLLKDIKKHFPKKPYRYLEPCVGGGAVYFDVWKRYRKKGIVLSDSNKNLIDTYIAVRDDPEHLIESISDLAKLYRQNDPKKMYLDIRDSYNYDPTPDKFIFLNKTGFNGLYRVNANGEYNVPWGQRPEAKIFTPEIVENLWECSEALQDAKLVTQDVLKMVDGTFKGDFMYIDPPYYGTFRGYTSMSKAYEHVFHQELAQRATKAVVGRGVDIMISNSHCEEVDKLYSTSVWRKHSVYARRSVSRKASGRKPEPEYLIASYGER